MAEKKYKVRFIPLFEWDLAEITDYITYHLRNPQAAYLLVGEIEIKSFYSCFFQLTHLKLILY